MTYTEIRTEYGDKIILRHNDDGSVSSIPCNLDNPDYQRYLNPEQDEFEILNGDQLQRLSGI